MSRTLEDIKQEYATAAMALGQITFQLRESEAQLEQLEQEARKQGDKMRHLNKEALKLHESSQPQQEEPVEQPKAD